MSQADQSSTNTTRHRFYRRGFSSDRAIKYFFASNAGLTIVILALIIVFLLKEGLGFFPGYRRELEVYRVAGLEYVDITRKNLTTHEDLTSVLNRAYYAEINGKSIKELRRTEEASALYNAYTDQIGGTRDLILNNPNVSGQTSSGMLARLHQNYEAQKSKALLELPKTPHLTDIERRSLVRAIKEQPIDAEGGPPFLTQLSEEYSAAQQIHATPLAEFRATIDAFESAGSQLSLIVSEMTQATTVTKGKVREADRLDTRRRVLLAAAAQAKTAAEKDRLLAAANGSLANKPDVVGPTNALLENRPGLISIHQQLGSEIVDLISRLPTNLTQKDSKRLIAAARSYWPDFLTDLSQTPAALLAWNPNQPVPISAAISSFLTGKNWVTGGEWQDFYGILPLAVGSLMISFVALMIAIPCGIGAAIYVNQFALPAEQTVVKPVIEFIQAIPSVVLGFIGILIFGTVLRDLSMLDSLQWVPGFPLEERLNIFTAGCLLALMSIPTIFSLAEDALNNVPSAYSEASEALGASRTQTTFRVVIPAAFSGILAAILLGFGRVIGETMVVLLIAGNRIKIPDFSAGIGTFFQPSHTLTGIIAQELGEVPMGSVHYRALFVVGILLFAVVLAINATAHLFFKRQAH